MSNQTSLNLPELQNHKSSSVIQNTSETHSKIIFVYSKVKANQTALEFIFRTTEIMCK